MSIEDRAQEHEQQHWELRNVNRKTAPPPALPTDADYGPEACVECESSMPEQRRAWRFQMCTPCTSEEERLQVLRRRRG